MRDIGEAQTDTALACALDERLVSPARAVLHGRLARAQHEGQLDRNANVEVIADALFAPIWFRRLVTGDPITRQYADAVVEAIIGEARTSPTSAGSCRSPSRPATDGAISSAG
jgi:hypothetical protein